MSENKIILYTTQDGKVKVELYALGESVYLSQDLIAKLFDTSKQNVSLHIKNILLEGELQENSVVKDYLTTALESAELRVKDNLEFQGKEILKDNGSISNEKMKEIVYKEYEAFNALRKKLEAQKADEEDMRELNSTYEMIEIKVRKNE